MAQITSFEIAGLHGVVNVSVPIDDGKVILVGVNGLGKTTIVTMLYFVLTRQWQKLLEYEFRTITVGVDGDRVEIQRSNLLQHDITHQSSMFEGIPLSVLDRILNTHEFSTLVRHAQTGRLVRAEVFGLSKKLDVPTLAVERLLFESARLGSKKQRRKNKELEDIEERLTKVTSQVLYLPTYRRIEQDLKSLFPEFEGDFRKVIRSRAVKDGRAGFVELVEFGMEDVESRVNARVASLKEGSRVELNNLAGGYLRDVIRGEAREWSEEKINLLEDREITLILGRVEERQLDEDDKQKVFEVIDRIRNRSLLNNDEDLLAHFFSKLVNIHETQKKAEVPLRQFINVCNRYLQAKKFIFDDVGYSLTLELERGGTIEMKGLSSGEKQIVSLFAQIYLGEADSYAIIIDEPELSLSVEWQKTLLPDIIASGRCHILAAVTHSPFIYENGLYRHAKDLAQLQGTAL